MTARELPYNEWHRLAGTEAEQVWPTLNQGVSTVVVVEDEGRIVGCHILMYLLHAECLWIHPDHRGRSSVARRLWSAVQRLATAAGATTLITAACDERVRGLLAHVGAVELPGRHYVVPLKG